MAKGYFRADASWGCQTCGDRNVELKKVRFNPRGRNISYVCDKCIKRLEWEKHVMKENLDFKNYLKEDLEYSEALAKSPELRKAAEHMPMPRGWFSQFWHQDLNSLQKEKEYRTKQEKQYSNAGVRFGVENEYTEDFNRRMAFLDAIINLKKAEGKK